MRFTLSLSDYFDQYALNRSDKITNCPVCYDTCMTLQIEQDLRHLLMCYKEDLLLRTVTEYHLRYGDTPVVTPQFVDRVAERVAHELARYCESHQKLFDQFPDL